MHLHYSLQTPIFDKYCQYERQDVPGCQEGGVQEVLGEGRRVGAADQVPGVTLRGAREAQRCRQLSQEERWRHRQRQGGNHKA